MYHFHITLNPVSNQILREHNVMFPLLSFSLSRIQRYKKYLATVVLFSAHPKFTSTERTSHSDDVSVTPFICVVLPLLQGQMLAIFFSLERTGP